MNYNELIKLFAKLKKLIHRWSTVSFGNLIYAIFFIILLCIFLSAYNNIKYWDKAISLWFITGGLVLVRSFFYEKLYFLLMLIKFVPILQIGLKPKTLSFSLKEVVNYF